MFIRRRLLAIQVVPTPPSPTGHTFEIGAPINVVAESFNVVANYDGVDVTTATTWSIVSGDTYVHLDLTGAATIDSSADENEVIISGTYAGLSEYATVIVTYKSGSSSHTETEVVTDASGNTTTTTTTTTENEDGSSSSSSQSITYDESGNTIGSQTNETVTNSDGSSSSTTINYNEDGIPTDGTNEVVDTDNNVSTQEVEYDESGNTVVTGYEIDTSQSQSGKTFNEDGVNTEFYGFDMTCGFIAHIHFTIDFTKQPAGQDENHHQILTMKRATPEPWYGFQIRQTGTNKYVQLGTQFAAGNNTNTQIPAGSRISTNVCEYDVQIIYDSTASINNFRATELISQTNFFVSSNTFPDLPELRYLTVCIGYGLNANGEPYRYSNINVSEFSIEKLCRAMQDPEISCDGKYVTIICDPSAASIYYRLNQTGNYVQYSAPFTISANTVVEAYSQLMSQSSNTVSALCIYDAIENPIITCDGEEITLTCETPSVDIYYRISGESVYNLYENPIAITADTTIEAYSELDGRTSETVSATCIYIPSTLVEPVISCDGSEVTITCITPGSTIYYRLDQQGNYAEYTSAIAITADTVVEAYSELDGNISTVVMKNCIYDPTHDYSLDYLTFNIISGGTVSWKALGSGYNRVIEYSINDGSWTSITATTASATFSVAAGDTVRFRGTNNTYAGSKSNYSGFEGGTAIFDVEGNIMSLVYGDNFIGNTGLTGTYNFCSIFKKTNCRSAENLILPSTTLTNYCYRAMFSWPASDITPSTVLLSVAPKLPATTLAQGCYWYMFENCAITEAPELLATTLVRESYGYMFNGCNSLNYIKCLAVSGFTAASALTGWVNGVAASGTFVKDSSASSWTTGKNGIPQGWVVYNGDMLYAPQISYDGDQEVTITCDTPGADIYYNVNSRRSYTLYTGPFCIDEDSTVDAYSSKNGQSSTTVSETCIYTEEIPLSGSNKTISAWTYNNVTIQTPYSINAIDGHSSNYAKGTFNFETTLSLRHVQPTYLWFQHADQSADIYVDNVKVETHWGGYNAFFSDITNYIHKGTNRIKVALCNTTRNTLAPAAGDFNFNATLGNVKCFTSPVLPDMSYGYDGFHVTSDVTTSSATVYVETTIPAGAEVVCTIDDGTYHHTETKNSTGSALTFTTVISSPHLWNGTLDPHLYDITVEIYYEGDLYHRFTRPYGLRYYSYVINDSTVLTGGTPYTGFLLNGEPYYLRGVCMHDDVDGRANALTTSDYTQEFNIIQELGCNFIRLAHYPHPKEVYDWCDQLGIIVQTEVPCVNKLQSTMPTDYYDHLTIQYQEMVNQHYNHPCIMFWGLSNETTTDDKTFGKTKIEEYTSLIKSLDHERLVGYVMSHSYSNPYTYYNSPDGIDWLGCNIYVGWYIDKASNDPTSQLNTRVTNIITNAHKALAFSEYGAGGTQTCHSEEPQTTTTKGNYERHDIEYQMWLHEGHIAAIRNFPQLLFTAEWQLFDIAVSNRNEGYTESLDGETTSTNDNLRRLNNKGLVERDHIKKKDTFYIYKAEWSNEQFIHICGKDYTRKTDRVIKCYTNDGNSLSLYVNGTFVETATVTDHIAMFTSANYSSGDIIRVSGTKSSDTFTFD